MHKLCGVHEANIQRMHTKSQEKCAGHSWFGAPVVLCIVQGEELERKEFSSVLVSSKKKRWSTGERPLRLVQYNLSLMELISLHSGPLKSSHTASRQPQVQARQDCFQSSCPLRQMSRTTGLSETSQVKPAVFKRSHHHPHVIPTQQPEESWSKLQWAMSFSPSPRTL